MLHCAQSLEITTAAISLETAAGFVQDKNTGCNRKEGILADGTLQDGKRILDSLCLCTHRDDQDNLWRLCTAQHFPGIAGMGPVPDCIHQVRTDIDECIARGQNAAELVPVGNNFRRIRPYRIEFSADAEFQDRTAVDLAKF